MAPITFYGTSDLVICEYCGSTISKKQINYPSGQAKNTPVKEAKPVKASAADEAVDAKERARRAYAKDTRKFLLIWLIVIALLIGVFVYAESEFYLGLIMLSFLLLIIAVAVGFALLVIRALKHLVLNFRK